MVAGIGPPEEGRRRLMDLGFTGGAAVKKLLPGRGMDAYWVGGALIALRRCDAGRVTLK